MTEGWSNTLSKRNPKSPWNPAYLAHLTPEEYEKQVVSWLREAGQREIARLHLLLEPMNQKILLIGGCLLLLVGCFQQNWVLWRNEKVTTFNAPNYTYEEYEDAKRNRDIAFFEARLRETARVMELTRAGYVWARIVQDKWTYVDTFWTKRGCESAITSNKRVEEVAARKYLSGDGEYPGYKKEITVQDYCGPRGVEPKLLKTVSH